MPARRSSGAMRNSSASAAPVCVDTASSPHRSHVAAATESASASYSDAACGIADEALGAREQPRRVHVERVGDVVARHLGLPRARGRGIRVEPVAVLERLRGQHDPVAGAAAQVAHPPAHAVELPFEHLRAAVRLVHRERHDGRGIRPARHAPCCRWACRPSACPRRRMMSGTTDGHTALVGLVDLEVAQPRHPERLGVQQRVGGRREGLRVAGPAEALVALRAVGRHRDEVVALGPQHVRVELVERRVARSGTCSRGSRSLEIAMAVAETTSASPTTSA